MRRPEKTTPLADTWALLERVPFVHLAGSTADGTPVLRALNHVVHEGALWFHGAPKGEKLGLAGRPVVASAVEDLGRIPSYAEHAERACPATTWYRSAQVHGVLEAVEDPVARAGALKAMMERLQPEGGYVPITADAPMYRGAVRGLTVLRLSGRVVGKHSIGHTKPLAARVRTAEALWARGAPGDVELIEAMRDACVEPTPLPFLNGPPGSRLRCALAKVHVPACTGLLRDAYWSRDRSDDEIAASQLQASAWVGAEDTGGALIGTARAVSDGVRYAWIGDVCVREDWRRRGLGRAIVRTLLDHPAVRRCRRVVLATQDPAFYQPLGFTEPPAIAGRSQLELRRDPAPAPAVSAAARRG
jgi:nitroimidazol reductase NimA-like FMN-containing flavoprotein (pyridoxamine 5'-phosphate oxidase superfamily)/GNAT superfamily N-acetyltransferase